MIFDVLYALENIFPSQARYGRVFSDIGRTQIHLLPARGLSIKRLRQSDFVEPTTKTSTEDAGNGFSTRSCRCPCLQRICSNQYALRVLFSLYIGCIYQTNSTSYPQWDGKKSTSQSAVMLCGSGVKAGMVHSTRG